MMTRGRLVIAVSLLALTGLAVALLLSTRPRDPLTVAGEWTAARNRGDIEAAMSLLGETGDIFGIGIHLPGGRATLRELMEAQAVAGYTVVDTACTADDEQVTCRYRQRDRILDAWGLTLTGEHRYLVRDGRLVRAARVHDPASQAEAYGVFDDFRTWIRQEHPELFDVIWVNRTSALYTTAEGAMAILGVLDAYEPPR